MGFTKGYVPWNKGLKNYINAGSFKKGNSINTGKHRLEETKRKISNAKKGVSINWVAKAEKHHLWKGIKVKYSGLHKWVNKNLGRPKKCSFCFTIVGEFEWANKSHEYKRDLTDWLRLCVKCHKAYDKK